MGTQLTRGEGSSSKCHQEAQCEGVLGRGRGQHCSRYQETAEAASKLGSKGLLNMMVSCSSSSNLQQQPAAAAPGVGQYTGCIDSDGGLGTGT